MMLRARDNPFATERVLRERYRLDPLPTTADELLEEIGRRRGGLRKGGGVDLHKAAAILLHEFRSGTIGRISLERPEPPNADAAPVLSR